LADIYKVCLTGLSSFRVKTVFFLFGARGTGKTLLLKERFKDAAALYIDLLDPELNQTYSLRPQTLREQPPALPKQTEWIIIDEIQKVPVLLDVVHQQIEASRFKFALSGSSAR
jgi:predicted AAA+ superfamily ATPase